jgi:DNA-binding XRE family transcriptional regulator
MSVAQIGKIIKQRRAELNITQAHLADLVEISVNTLYKLERGEGNPSLKIVTEICEVLGLEFELDIKKI